MTRRLIDVSKLVLKSATCEAGGKTLHDQADCPQDRTCPVWVSFQPRAVRQQWQREDALPKPDAHGNTLAQEGVDQCACGCKYWENDRCIDCGSHVASMVRQ